MPRESRVLRLGQAPPCSKSSRSSGRLTSRRIPAARIGNSTAWRKSISTGASISGFTTLPPRVTAVEKSRRNLAAPVPVRRPKNSKPRALRSVDPNGSAMTTDREWSPCGTSRGSLGRSCTSRACQLPGQMSAGRSNRTWKYVVSPTRAGFAPRGSCGGSAAAAEPVNVPRAITPRMNRMANSCELSRSDLTAWAEIRITYHAILPASLITAKTVNRAADQRKTPPAACHWRRYDI